MLRTFLLNRRLRKRGRLIPLLIGLALNHCAPSDSVNDTIQQTAPLIGKDGSQTITALGQTVNTYADLAANATQGATSITVSNVAPGLGFLTAGDLLLVIQMQGATVDTIDAASYGTVTSVNGAGLYEFVGVSSVNGNTINLETGCGGLRNSYSVAGRTQVLRVPQYTSLTVQTGSSIVAPAWNGVTGGVVALYVQNAITFNGTGKIDVSGAGFRGGAVDTSSQPASSAIDKYRSTDPLDGAEKGEGIAGYEADLPSGRYGRGAAANGGGGGNSNLAGGGGGANGDNGQTWTGNGVMDATAFGSLAWSLDPAYMTNNQLTTSGGGGRGGYSSATSNQDARSVGPGNTAWAGNNHSERGGRGGHPISNSPGARVYLGGGGGAGDEVGTTGAGSVGGSGGGLVLLFARDISGSGGIFANGAAGGDSRTVNDGAGGGGAGGTIVVSASRSLSGVNLQANGGTGGNSSSNGTNSQGPGGGGGGGYIAIAGGTVPLNTLGGAGGLSSAAAVTEFPYNGATGGAIGQPSASANLASGKMYPACVPTDLVVSVTPGPGPIPPGGTAQFTIAIKNLGPTSLNDIVLSEQAVWSTSGLMWTCTGASGALCRAQSGSGGISGLIDLPVGGELDYVISGPVPANLTSGPFMYSAAAAVPNGYTDPNSANNSASASVNVLSGNLIDLKLQVNTTPTEPAVGEAVAYVFTVSNQGPGSTSMPTVSFMLPTGASLQEVTLGDGWNCTTSNQLVSCTRSAVLAPSQSSDLRLVIMPPDGATSMSIAATVTASDGADKNYADNSVNWVVSIGASTIYAAGGGLGCSLGLATPDRHRSPGELFVYALVGLGLFLRRRRRPLRRAYEVG